MASLRAAFSSVDKPFLYGSIVLVIVGFLILASASAALSEKNFGITYYYIFNQFTRGFLVGLVGFCIGFFTPVSFWKKSAVPLMIGSLVLMALVFLPSVGFSHGGATRWLSFGPIVFQPSEILKFVFVIYLAGWLESRRHALHEYSSAFIPFIIMMSIVAVFLMMQPDIGTLGVIAFTSLIMYFFAGGRASQLIVLVLLGVLFLVTIIQLAPYRLDRLTVFLDPSHDPQGKGYQINQALIAIGSGGFSGLGLGASREKYSYLPEPIGDSIFAVYAEEFGFAGAVALIAFFLFFLWRAIRIGIRAPTLFGTFCAVGLSSMIVVQACVNIAAISGLLPLTGVPLPFVSYGGTSLALMMTSVGILLTISKNS